MGTNVRTLIGVAAAATLALGCGGDEADVAPVAAQPGTLAGVPVHVQQSESCDCCGGWVEEIEALGADVEVTYLEDVVAAKDAAGVPHAAASCHTSTVGPWAVEGHVPVEALLDLLDSEPDVDGIALPGMPAGSPGMPGEQQAPFEVVSFSEGEVVPFGSY